MEIILIILAALVVGFVVYRHLKKDNELPGLGSGFERGSDSGQDSK